MQILPGSDLAISLQLVNSESNQLDLIAIELQFIADERQVNHKVNTRRRW